ncbi:MAG TPA: hypothetical protein VK675_00235, partial [Candidatus Paceibacterota bacterium]|nr:hypothetical protein [Candidatus Paceibacterota bacterium]
NPSRFRKNFFAQSEALRSEGKDFRTLRVLLELGSSRRFFGGRVFWREGRLQNTTLAPPTRARVKNLCYGKLP